MRVLLTILLVLMFLVTITIMTLKRKIVRYLRQFNIKNADDLIDAFSNNDTPKSLSGLENLILPELKKDFPNINLDELKRQTESYIITYLNMLENKLYKEIPYASDKVIKEIKSNIANDTKNEEYKSIKIHRTVLNKYEKNNGFSTIKFQTALEYLNSKNEKIQDRFVTELIYVVNEKEVSETSKVLGLNCPNCGSPVKNLKNEKCSYCGTGLIDLAKRVWYLNSIENK